MRWTGPQKFKSFQCKKIECDALFAEVETRVGPTSSICHRSPIDGDDLADFGIEWWQFHLVWPVSCHRGIISEKRTYFLMFFKDWPKKGPEDWRKPSKKCWEHHTIFIAQFFNCVSNFHEFFWPFHKKCNFTNFLFHCFVNT